MFVRKLQVICILLILVILVKTSTAGLVTTNDTKNYTSIANTTADHAGVFYPTHTVWAMIRGYTEALKYVRLHWVDYTEQPKQHEGIYPDTEYYVASYTSPPWAVGYFYEIWSPDFDTRFWTDTILWWDGW
ncbi:11018_t:CDS:1, partial [Paraglomus occultum]